jgi:zinc transporter 10
VLRLARPERIDDPELVLIVGTLGLAVNVVGLLIFQDCASWFSCCIPGRRRRPLQQPQPLDQGPTRGAFGGTQGAEGQQYIATPVTLGLDSAVTLRGSSVERKQKGATVFSNVAGAFRLHPLDRFALPFSSSSLLPLVPFSLSHALFFFIF